MTKEHSFEKMLAGLKENSERASKLPKPDASVPRISSYATDDPTIHSPDRNKK